MSFDKIDLLASYWTIAGDTFPGKASEVSPFPLRDRAETAGKAGWRGMGLLLSDLVASVELYGAHSVRDILADNGMAHVEIEFLLDWHLDGAKRAAADHDFHEMLDLGGKFGAAKIKVGGGVFETGAPDVPRFREAFAVLCDKAAPYKIDVVIEFLPFASIDTIARGLAVMEGLGRTNGGLLVDIWHVDRGGMTFDDVRKLPLSRFKAVELNDADATVVGSLFDDSTHHRKLCGEGALDVPGFIQAVLDAGYSGYWGVEVLSAELRKLPLEEAARRSFETTKRQFEAVSARRGQAV